MYRNVLIATDGSELAQTVDQGVAMAQAINAKVTVVTVSEPFHAFAVQPRMVTDTREQYEQQVAACAAEYLAAASCIGLRPMQLQLHIHTGVYK